MMVLHGEAAQDGRLWRVTIGLTLSEASELRDALNELLEDRNPDWHAHVSSADFQTELMVTAE